MAEVGFGGRHCWVHRVEPKKIDSSGQSEPQVLPTKGRDAFGFGAGSVTVLMNEKSIAGVSGPAPCFARFRPSKGEEWLDPPEFVRANEQALDATVQEW